MSKNSPDTVAAAYQRFVDAGVAVSTARYENERKAAYRARWTAVRDILSFFLKSNPPELPGEAAFFLMDNIDHLLAGGRPDAINALARPRAPESPPKVQRMVHDAMLYVRAVESGLIPDRKPRQTILEAYGIEWETYRRWRRSRDVSWLDDELADLTSDQSKRWPTAVQEYRSAQRELRLRRIERLMRISGEHYQRLSRRGPKYSGGI